MIRVAIVALGSLLLASFATVSLVAPPRPGRIEVMKVSPHPEGAVVRVRYDLQDQAKHAIDNSFHVFDYDPPTHPYDAYKTGRGGAPHQRNYGSAGSYALAPRGTVDVVLNYDQLGITRGGRYWLIGKIGWTFVGMSADGKHGGAMELPPPSRRR